MLTQAQQSKNQKIRVILFPPSVAGSKWNERWQPRAQPGVQEWFYFCWNQPSDSGTAAPLFCFLEAKGDFAQACTECWVPRHVQWELLARSTAQLTSAPTALLETEVCFEFWNCFWFLAVLHIGKAKQGTALSFFPSAWNKVIPNYLYEAHISSFDGSWKNPDCNEDLTALGAGKGKKNQIVFTLACLHLNSYLRDSNNKKDI